MTLKVVAHSSVSLGEFLLLLRLPKAMLLNHKVVSRLDHFPNSLTGHAVKMTTKVVQNSTTINISNDQFLGPPANFFGDLPVRLNEILRLQ